VRVSAPPLALVFLLVGSSVGRAQSEDSPDASAAKPSAATPATQSGAPAATPTGPPTFYETTTVTARPVSSAIASVSVVPAEQAFAAGARTATDLLQGLPGLEPLRSGGRAGQTNLYLRGGDPNYTLILLDGVPLNDSTDLQGGTVNLEELPADLVERAEIVRGPFTSFYGTSSLSGVVQLFTPRGGPGPLRASAGAEAGDASMRHAFARVQGPAGTSGGFSGGVSWDEERHRIADDRFRQIDTWAGGVVALGTSELRLSGRFASGSADDYPDASGGPVYGSGELRTTDHQDLALAAQLELGAPGGRRQHLAFGLARRARDVTSPAIPPAVPASSEQVTFTRLRLAWQAPILRKERTEVDAGASGEGEWGDNTSVLELPPFLGGDVSGDYGKTRATGGVYGGVRHRRGRVLLEAALRADFASTDAAQLNPRAGAVVELCGGTRLRASVGRASKLPSFFALASPRALGGNPALRPERTWGGDAGIEHSRAGGRLELGASYFLQQYQDLVDFDFEQFLHVNRAQVRMQGVELRARLQPFSSLSVEAEATWLDAKDLRGGRLLHRPHWTGSLLVGFRPLESLSLRVQARAVSPYFDEQIPVPDQDTVPGYGLLGLSGSWRFHRGLSLRGRVDNLTGRAYETLIGFPGPGRSFWLGVGWDRG
jgi:vitamin B12 transporter